jgi:hypothetical protein
MMRTIALSLVLLLAACALPPRVASPQKLYFALELRQQGRLVGRPKLLGEEGKSIRVERREPGSAQPDYRLRLSSWLKGPDDYLVDLQLALPGAQGHSKLSLLHGEERTLELGLNPGDLEVTLLVMKVDSSEFEALMSLPDSKLRQVGSI